MEKIYYLKKIYIILLNKKFTNIRDIIEMNIFENTF